jgi:hypothetical protein
LNVNDVRRQRIASYLVTVTEDLEFIGKSRSGDLRHNLTGTVRQLRHVVEAIDLSSQAAEDQLNSVSTQILTLRAALQK